ncbi:MAG: TIGR02587 family membrane protein [Chloroflexota bacterium]|nr:TIGR02587 family membrane protein [Chloroflexota bacterium]
MQSQRHYEEQRREGAWTEEWNDLVRSFTGAFLFGIPFLYTMEMWWIATYLDYWKLFSFLVVGFVVNIFLGHLIHREEPSLWEATAEALYNMTIGIVGATLILLILARILPSDPLHEILAKVLVESLPLSIGAAVTRKMRREQERATAAGQAQREEKGQEQSGAWNMVGQQVGITVAGALFLSFPLASTEEIQLLAAGTSDWNILLLVLFSLLVTYIIIYRSSLAPSWAGGAGAAPLPDLTDTLMTYSVALAAALVTLFLFDRIDIGDPLIYIVTQAVVLGLPATVGGAAGRHLV